MPLKQGIRESEQSLWHYIERNRVCMVLTADSNAQRARSMKALVESENNVIWFITDENGPQVEELQSNDQAVLTFANIKIGDYISVSGRMELFDDIDKMRALWDDATEGFFPEGPRDAIAGLHRFYR